jgi:hypothetical protein
MEREGSAAGDAVPEGGPNMATPSIHPWNQYSSRSRKLVLQKFSIYETSSRVYIVGSNGRETMFRVLEIDLTVAEHELAIVEDNVFYTRKEILNVLEKLEETNPEGLNKKLTGVGLLGFIRFTKCYYLCVVTKRSVVAVLGGHYIYHIDDTDLIPLKHNYKKPDKYSEEARFLSTFANMDLSKAFYFSYTYDITNTLQRNILREKQKALGFESTNKFHEQYNAMFVWNSSLLKPVIEKYERVYDWFQPIVHGFIDQANISIFEKKVYITVIARRSHHFAGARFLKRGVNNQGDVANEVETEQIVSDLVTTSFHDSKYGIFSNPRYTSYVQHRGSIPLYWSQEASNLNLAKPPIEINLVDPFYTSAALHFDDLFKRYDAPVMILNLIKTKERTPRETKLLKEFENCINYLNITLPEKYKLNYTSWDMSRASKSDGQDVIEYLESYADDLLCKTGIFHNGVSMSTTKLQEGICRTNCIDCLDRTNAAQFVIGKRALGYQLKALGVVEDVLISYDSDVVNILTEMFHDHGDTIALQYGGSHLVNTMETYRKINQWSSHSRDMIESIKRFYSNSFIDAQRQEAINLFLGNYVWEQGKPMLWDFNTDYYLHNIHNSDSNGKRSYRYWWTDSNLKGFFDTFEVTDEYPLARRLEPYHGFFDNYWNEYYIPRIITFFDQLFEINMNSTLRYMSSVGNSTNEKFDISPFKSRKNTSINNKLKKKEYLRKELLRKERARDDNQKEYSNYEEFNFLVSKKQLKNLKEFSNKVENIVQYEIKSLGFEFHKEDQNDSSTIGSVSTSAGFDDILQLAEFEKEIGISNENLQLYEDVCSDDYIKSIRRQLGSTAIGTGSRPAISDEYGEVSSMSHNVSANDLGLYESITNLHSFSDVLNENRFSYIYNDGGIMEFFHE